MKNINDYLSYNHNTGELLWTRNYGKAKFGQRFGTPTDGYIQGSFNCKRVYAHRIAWLMHYGEMPQGEIDHINGVRDDNRIANLRVTTRQENSTNISKARITAKGVKYFLGLYDDINDAAKAYLQAKMTSSC